MRLQRLPAPWVPESWSCASVHCLLPIIPILLLPPLFLLCFLFSVITVLPTAGLVLTTNPVGAAEDTARPRARQVHQLRPPHRPVPATGLPHRRFPATANEPERSPPIHQKVVGYFCAGNGHNNPPCNGRGPRSVSSRLFLPSVPTSQPACAFRGDARFSTYVRPYTGALWFTLLSLLPRELAPFRPGASPGPCCARYLCHAPCRLTMRRGSRPEYVTQPKGGGTRQLGNKKTTRGRQYERY